MEIIFNNSEINTIQFLSSQIKWDAISEAQLFCNQSKKLSMFIPLRIRTILDEFKIHGSPNGYLLMKTFPLQNIPKTPTDNLQHLGSYTELARIQAILNSYLGEMVSYEAENHGYLFQDMVPSKNFEMTQTSLGSKVELEIHTEQAFSHLKPDILSLLCLKGDIHAKTYIFHVQNLLDHITIDEEQLLRQPLWLCGIDHSFSFNHSFTLDTLIRGPMPIIYGSKEDPYFVFDKDLMVGITEESNTILDKIIYLYEKYRSEYTLQAGDILFIDNNRAVHGRSSFEPKFDGKDRFIVRSFVMNEERYKNSFYARADRMILYVYS
jgi:hypothetical protein